MQDRNDELRGEIQSLRQQLNELKETQYGSKEAFVVRYVLTIDISTGVIGGEWPGLDGNLGAGRIASKLTRALSTTKSAICLRPISGDQRSLGLRNPL